MISFIHGLVATLIGAVVGALALYGWQHRAQVQDAYDRLREWIHRP